MSFRKWTIWRYTLPLRRPLTVQHHETTTREGLILQLIGDNGAIGLGEAAPLPGLHTETLEDAAAQLQAWCESNQAKPPSQNDTAPAYPSTVAFAISNALSQLGASTTPPDSIAVYSAGLVNGSIDECLDQALAQAKAGARAIKVKVGRRPLEQDKQLIRTLRSALDADIEIRADANRAWRLGEAESFAAVQDCISFVEEPLQDPTGLPALCEKTGMSVALDESVLDQPDLKETVGVNAVVLKPTLLGRINSTIAWIKWAQQNDKRAIISATFESDVGQRAIARIAAQLPNEVHGLGTWAWFEVPLVGPGPRFENGTLTYKAPQTLDTGSPNLVRIAGKM